MKIANCLVLAAMFGIVGSTEDNDNNSAGATRLYGAVDANCAVALTCGGKGEEGQDKLLNTLTANCS